MPEDRRNNAIKRPTGPSFGYPIIVYTGELIEGSTLFCDTSYIFEPDRIGYFSFQWMRNGEGIDGALNTLYTLVKADVGTTISVYVTYTDGRDNFEGPVVSKGVYITNADNSLPVGLPEISGEAKEEQWLVCSTNLISDADGLGPFSYTWKNSSPAIIQLGGTLYQIQNSDITHTITCEVTYTDQNGTDEGPLISAPTATVVAKGAVPVINFTGFATNDDLQFYPTTLDALPVALEYWITESIDLPTQGTGHTAAYYLTETGYTLPAYGDTTLYAHARNAIGYATPVSLIVSLVDTIAPIVGYITTFVISDNQINIICGNSTDSGSGILECRVMKSDDSINWLLLSTVEPTGGLVTHTGLLPNQTVYYKLEAEDLFENISTSAVTSETTTFTQLIGIALTNPQSAAGLILDDPVVIL